MWFFGEGEGVYATMKVGVISSVTQLLKFLYWVPSGIYNSKVKFYCSWYFHDHHLQFHYYQSQRKKGSLRSMKLPCGFSNSF